MTSSTWRRSVVPANVTTMLPVSVFTSTPVTPCLDRSDDDTASAYVPVRSARDRHRARVVLGGAFFNPWGALIGFGAGQTALPETPPAAIPPALFAPIP
jgi:hypothetical protein